MPPLHPFLAFGALHAVDAMGTQALGQGKALEAFLANVLERKIANLNDMKLITICSPTTYPFVAHMRFQQQPQ